MSNKKPQRSKMTRVIGFLFVSVCLALGCGRQSGWEITVENKGKIPASVFVTMGVDGSSKASVNELAEGKTITLIAGQTETIVHTVKVVLGKNEQVHEFNDKLRGGKRYAIMISAEGKVETSTWDK